MNRIKKVISIMLLFCLFEQVICVAQTEQQSSETTEILYFGQKPPGKVPEIFAPGVISLETRSEAGPRFSEDGKQMFFRDGKEKITYLVEQNNGQLTQPRRATFLSDKGIGLPTISSDGTSYLISKKGDIWMGRRDGNTYFPPEKVPVVSSEKYECGFSMALNGNMYFASQRSGTKGNCDIYCSEFVDGKYQEPKNLSILNTPQSECNVYICPTEEYIIFTSQLRKDGLGRNDMYISFLSENKQWSSPRNMGPDFNSKEVESPTCLSPDGKYFFFIRVNETAIGKQFDIYWVNAQSLQSFKPDNKSH
jgi:hypothetical protein